MWPLIDIAIFTAKTAILLILILAFLAIFIAILAKNKQKSKGRFVVKNLNEKYTENAELILEETYSKTQLKNYLKKKKAQEKKAAKTEDKTKNVYVLNFEGDIKASAVCHLSEEITTILNVATPKDEVVIKVDSAGGMVHGYGLAAAQLMRLRKHHIPLTVMIDKIAASGGYLMSCVANKIYAAPFAIVGSIGVIVQLPNFHRYLKDKHIDFEQHTAGEFKRTITVFGENTEEGREKLQHEIEDVHQLFKNLITEYRPFIDINKVATGEHWLGQQALGLKLIDEIKTSDEYLFERSKEARVLEICYEIKKPLLARLTSNAAAFKENTLARLFG